MHESDGGDEPVRHRPNPDDPAAPLQLGDIQADDALIDALGSGSLRATDELATSDDVDDRLAAMLASWVAAVQEPAAPRDAAIAAAAAAAPRPETGAESADAPTSTTDARAPRHRRRRDRPGYVIRLSAAAVVAIAVTGGVAVGNADTARPGDVLWPVAKVFYREHARSVEAADTVTVHLERARTALREGRTADAAREVNDMQAALAVILPADGRADLGAQHTSIVAIVAATPDAVLLDPQLRGPVVPDVAGAKALGLPRAPGLPDPSTTAPQPTEALQSSVAPATSGGPTTSGTSDVPPVAVTPPVEPPPATVPPAEPPTDTAPVEPPPYVPPRTDPPAVDPGTGSGGGGTDAGMQTQGPAEPPATTEAAAVEQPGAAGTGAADTTSTDGGAGSGGTPADASAGTAAAENASDTSSGDQSGAQNQDQNSQGSGSGDSQGQDAGGSLLSVSADASLGVGGTPVSGTLGLSLG
ncbi:MAG: hypothetical protein EKK42_14100 [Pseudonocardiaceae bacterium]|nr:MAG: hypothetical protein EKK42_14100 [Pseudonocardiaceae bacterium]